jgi:GntR family histidine utilization transcriptional repressor
MTRDHDAPAPDPPPPRYQEVKVAIRDEIADGRWRPGDRVPSESALMRRHGVSRMTVNRALRELVAEGLIRRVKGSGSFVADLHPVASLLRVRPIEEEVAERGHRHSARVLGLVRERCDALVAAQLGLRPRASVFHVRIVHLENGVPIQLEDRWVNPAVAPDFLDLDFTVVTPSRHLFDRAPLTEAEQLVEAVGADEVSAPILQVAYGTPCLLVTRKTWSGPTVASVARLLHPGARYRLSGSYRP